MCHLRIVLANNGNVVNLYGSDCLAFEVFSPKTAHDASNFFITALYARKHFMKAIASVAVNCFLKQRSFPDVQLMLGGVATS